MKNRHFPGRARRLRLSLLALGLLPATLLAGDKFGAKGGVDKKTGEAIDAAVAKGRAWLKPEVDKELGTPFGGSITHKSPDGKDHTFSFPLGRPAQGRGKLLWYMPTKVMRLLK